MTTDEADTIRTNIAGLKSITANRYPGFVMSIPDTVRAALFADSVASWERQGRFPDLVILYLPRDHTVGRRADEPHHRAPWWPTTTWRSGAWSSVSARSPFWTDLALFALEDDAQNGPDHVDAHRSVLLVALALRAPRRRDSTLYTTSSVLRHDRPRLLGLPPLSQYDAGATPLWGAFGTGVDATPFHRIAESLAPRRAQRARVPLARTGARSGPSRPGRRRGVERGDLGERASTRSAAPRRGRRFSDPSSLPRKWPQMVKMPRQASR